LVTRLRETMRSLSSRSLLLTFVEMLSIML
jgi:hypothetical protein